MASAAVISQPAVARQGLDLLVVVLVLVLVPEVDAPVRVAGPDGEAAAVEAAVVKAREGAARPHHHRLYVVPVPEVCRVPPLEHHLNVINL